MRLRRRALAEADYSATRRSFLRTSAIAAAVASTPLFLEGCSKAVSSQVDRAVKVAVVGAGIAGLHATWLLKKAGVNVELIDKLADTGDEVDAFHFNGRAYTMQDIVREIRPFLARIAEDLARLPETLCR